MIEELPDGKVRVYWDFLKYQLEQIEVVAQKIDKNWTAGDLMMDAVTGFLQRNGLDPNKWI